MCVRIKERVPGNMDDGKKKQNKRYRTEKQDDDPSLLPP